MKKNIIRIVAVLLGFASVACLDDNKYALDPSGSENVIEFLDNSVPNSPAGAVYPLWTKVTEVAPSFVFEQTISYSGPNSNNKDIDLLVEVDPAALAEYNQQMTDVLFDDTYPIMPPSYYDFPPTMVTIPKGKNKVTFEITVFPDQFDLSQTFALPLRITSASDGLLSQHFSAGLFVVVVKNIYDGIYNITEGKIIRNSGTGPDPVFGGDYSLVPPIKIPFVTITGTTTAFQPTWKEGSPVGGIDGTRVEVLGGTYTPPGAFTAPATAQPIKITSSANASLANTATRLNYYDPAEKTFVMNFSWNPGGSSRVIEDLKLKWTSSR